MSPILFASIFSSALGFLPFSPFDFIDLDFIAFVFLISIDMTLLFSSDFFIDFSFATAAFSTCCFIYSAAFQIL